MLAIIFIISFTLFGAQFPVFLWITSTKEVGTGFNRFSLGLSSIVTGIGVAFLWLMDVDFHLKLSSTVWLISLLTVTRFYWRRAEVHAWVVTIPSLLGVIVYFQIVGELITSDYSLWFVSFVGGLILTGSIFAMVMGHWYLKVVDLPAGLLRKSIRWLLMFLIVRAAWDLVFVLTDSVDLNGELMPLTTFLESFSGFFLFIALFFGTFIPMVLSLFVLRTIGVHVTQSAAALLYAMVISVIMGDLLYKYYILQFGLFL